MRLGFLSARTVSQTSVSRPLVGVPSPPRSSFREALAAGCLVAVGAFLGSSGPTASLADESATVSSPRRQSAAPTELAVTPQPVSRIAGEVDRLLGQEASSPGAPVPLVDDETFLRRVTLDLIGQAPTPEETTLFALDTDPGKRSAIVDRLLADPRFGENWGRYWRDVIFYRRTEDRALIGSELCADYLAQQLNNNVAWDRVATALVTAEGEVLENGATALFFAHRGEPEAVVAEATRIFNGIQISCAQCHDHPTDRWKRDEFHRMAAFFPRVAVRPNPMKGPLDLTVTATDVEPRFGPRMPAMRVRGTLEHYMPDLKDPQAKGTLMQPVFFVTGETVPLGTKDASRRTRFAQELTRRENPWFARSMVNRVWAELVGEGFYEPVDDMGPDRQCSAPKTLDQLSSAFADAKHDVKHLFRVITHTAAYQRPSRSRRGPDDTPFAANVATRLRGDQLFNQLAGLLGIVEPPAGAVPGPAGNGAAAALRRGPRFLFNQVFGYDPSNPREEEVGSVPQALVLMNSPIINGAISSRRGVLASLLARIPKDDDLTMELYLRTLGREPNADELAACRELVKEAGDRGEAFEDILWSLINSTEFLHRK
ncbi:MAG: DUF1549 domain-containing protein [Planctomycetota bacterium]